MRQREIGDTSVTTVGVGDVRLAIAEARNVEVREVEHALHHALELGITLVDCSEEAAAEQLCGDVIRSMRLRDRVVLATRVPANERPHPRYVQDRIEASLRATRLDVLPLAQLAVAPAWLESSAWPELAGTCARLVREGKVLRWAARLDAKPVIVPERRDDDEPPPDPFAKLSETFIAISVVTNLCARTTPPTELPILAREPLAGGMLAGTFGPGVKLPLRDDRRTLGEPELERVAIGCAKLGLLAHDEPPAARSCTAARAILEQRRRPPHLEAHTIAELALRWVIDRGACALPRLHRREHVAAAIAAAAAPPLSAGLLATLETIFD